MDKLYYCFALFILPSLEKHKTSSGVLTTIEFKSPVSWQNPEKSFLFSRDGVKKKKKYSEAVTNENIYFSKIITMNNVNLRTIHIAYNMLILFITNS